MKFIAYFRVLLILIWYKPRQSKAITLLIGGGLTAVPGQFPWHVSINETKGLKCGGILISRQYVLTAAHCYHPKPDYTVGLGSIELNKQKYLIKPKKFIAHPDYKNGRNDIAVIQLERPVRFDKDIQPVKLATENMGDFSSACPYISGFGLTKDGNYSNSLQYLETFVLKSRFCAKVKLPKPFFDHKTLLCAVGHKESSASACFGDSGGGLVLGNPGVAIGVMSFVPGAKIRDDCFKKLPTFYTRISHYISWIQKVTGLDL